MFKRLVFSKLRNDIIQEECVGVVGYVFLMKKNKRGISYIPSTFIRALSRKAGLDIIDFLIKEDCIAKVDRNKEFYKIPQEIYDDIRVTEYFPENDPYVKIIGGNKSSTIEDNWKHSAYLYYIRSNLTLRDEYYVRTEEVTQAIISNIHWLNGLSFNHYKHCFLPLGGKLQYTYNIRKIYWDSKVDGRHYNIFTDNPNTVKLVLENPVFITLKDFLPLILADQLKKTFNCDEMYQFFLKPKYIKKEKRPQSFTEFYQVVPIEYFNAVIYGFDIIEKFKKPFPRTFDTLFKIKNGCSTLPKGIKEELRTSRWAGRYYELWQEGLFIKLQKTNWRISKDVSERAIMSWQPYYKIISYVLHTRQMIILIAVWNWIKKYKIPFIAFNDGVYVEEEQREWVENIFTILGEKYLNPKLRIHTETYDYEGQPLMRKYFFPFDELTNEANKNFINKDEADQLFKDLFNDEFFK